MLALKLRSSDAAVMEMGWPGESRGADAPPDSTDNEGLPTECIPFMRIPWMMPRRARVLP
jgi:hypothetical protein